MFLDGKSIFGISIFGYNFLLAKHIPNIELGKTLATIEIREHGNTISFYTPLPKQSCFLLAAHSEQILADYSQKVSKISLEDVARWENIANRNASMKNPMPYSDALNEILKEKVQGERDVGYR